MNKLTALLAGGDWTNLDKRCHMVEIADTPEELDMRGELLKTFQPLLAIKLLIENK